MLGDDLELVAGRHIQALDHRLLDGGTDSAEVVGRLAGPEVDSDEWHRTLPCCQEVSSLLNSK
jgi:hypothetical protein